VYSDDKVFVKQDSWEPTSRVAICCNCFCL